MKTTPEPRMKRLYRFMTAEAAGATVTGRTLRIGRINQFNDPFEFTVALPRIGKGWPEKDVDRHLCYLREHFDPRIGVVCFSERIGDPASWGHYADKHRGIALGFDFPQDENLTKVSYAEVRPKFQIDRLDEMTEAAQLAMAKKIVFTKALCWRYEREWRMFFDLEHFERYPAIRRIGIEFFCIFPDGMLKEVVLGMHCAVQPAEVGGWLDKAGLTNVGVSRARRSPTDFKVLTSPVV
jgi:hypothetical protein